MSSNGSESEFTSPPLLVSTLDVHIKPQSRKEIESIIVNTGTIKREIHQAISPGGSHQERFDPLLEVLLHTNFLVSIRYRGAFQRGIIHISLDPKTVLCEADEKDGKQVYCKTERNIEVAVGIQSLPSIVGEIVASCSRFRVLIIGNVLFISGVGKSSLINKVFGVSGVKVSDTTPGQAKIDQEHIACDNDRFVVHDSCGFEAADDSNLKDARNFIMGRRRMRDLKDQLHAVWLCLEIPFAGGRVIETGVEDFLKDRNHILGNIPLVVVLTKLDSLVNMLRTEALQTEALQTGQLLDGDALEERKRESLEELCLGPIRTATGNDDVPHVAVSTKRDYEGSVSALVEKTTRDIHTYIKDGAAHYIAAIAQRANMSLKVVATIAIGERRYWNTLKASPNFRGHTMKACLDVLHKDIVAVWNFKDPQRSLYGENFKEGLLNTPDLKVRGIQDLWETAQSSVSVIAALVTIVGSLAGTAGAALPIVVPVAGAIILCKLAHDVYKASHNIVRQLMAYVVDLTCVMQILFLLTAVRHGEVTAEAIDIAMQAYEQTHRPKVHADINAFSVHLAIAPGKRDDVLDKIKELIGKYRIPDENIAELRRQLH